jgi:hypothetical protein
MNDLAIRARTEEGVDVMKSRTRVASLTLVVIMLLALVPAAALARGAGSPGPKGEIPVPSWVTEVVAQVRVVAQDAATRLKAVYDQARADVQQVVSDTRAQLEGVTDPAQKRSILKQAGARMKEIWSKARADARAVVEQAAARIKAIIEQAKSNAAGLTATLKAKVMVILAGLRKYIPRPAF